MKTVLCYGDSNTFGYNPEDGMRYPWGVRWTSLLQRELDHRCKLFADADADKVYRIVEEGCGGRTTVFTDPKEPWKNGFEYLKPCLNSHKPIDIVIMMLGTNDLKKMFKTSAADSARGVEKLIKTIIEFTKLKQGYVPKIVLVSPVHIGADVTKLAFRNSFAVNSATESHKFSGEFRKVAEKYGCSFLDAALVAEPSKLDCLHLSEESHLRLAHALAEIVVTL